MIFVVKYRKELLVGEVSEDMKQIVFEISKLPDSLFSIETMETDKNHIHMLIDIDPTVSASSIVSRIKSISTKRERESQRSSVVG